MKIPIKLLDIIMVCKKCGHEMLAIDVAVVKDKIVCPQCHGGGEVKDA